MAWSEGIDVGSDQGIKMVVERAGLDWAAASEVIDNTDWEGPMEETACKCWRQAFGVPSYRLLDDKGREVFPAGARSHLAFGA